jgi:2-phospho-L-lactate guanylyltransferase
MEHASESTRWTAVVPVKPLSSAKSRLSAAGGENLVVADLALAFLQDVLAALSRTASVAETIVASADPAVREVATSSGASALDDTGHDGINAAARWAAESRTTPGSILVLVADLPCLTSTCLERVLRSAAQHPLSFVTDLEGVGTTMWLARDAGSDGPHFGPRSRAAHRSHGAVDLVAAAAGAAGPWLPARLDVDTPADLDRAREQRLGPATAALLAGAPQAVPLTVIRTEIDAVIAADEDGRVHRLPLSAAHDAGWRHLEQGQRVLVAADRIRPGG